MTNSNLCTRLCFFKLLMPNSNLSVLDFVSKLFDVLLVKTSNWASEASPTLGCSIEISRDIYMCVCRMSNHVESRESNTRMLKVSNWVVKSDQ